MFIVVNKLGVLYLLLFSIDYKVFIFWRSKMRNILFICNTHFQVLIAVILKSTKYSNSNVDIIITDQMNGSMELYQRLKNVAVFGDVYYVEVKNALYVKSKVKRLEIEFIPSNYKKIIDIDFSFYDELFLYNTDFLAELVCLNLRRINPEITINLFDEGVSTYSRLYEKILYSKTKISYFRGLMKRLTGRKYIADIAENLYLLDPELICWDFKGKIHKIDKLDFSNPKIIKLINDVFGFREDHQYEVDYIFFEESYFADGKDVGDLNLIQQIINIIPREKLIVKIHPRNRENRFEKMSITTNTITAIPWEVIALNLKEGGRKKFITISSSAVLSSFLLFGSKQRVVMLYRYADSKELNEEYFEYFEKFKAKYPKVLSIPYNREELEELLLTCKDTDVISGNRDI